MQGLRRRLREPRATGHKGASCSRNQRSTSLTRSALALISYVCHITHMHCKDFLPKRCPLTQHKAAGYIHSAATKNWGWASVFSALTLAATPAYTQFSICRQGKRGRPCDSAAVPPL